MQYTKQILDFLEAIRNGNVDDTLINGIIQELITKRDNTYAAAQGPSKSQKEVNILLLQLQQLT
jgi:hypothetical protein